LEHKAGFGTGGLPSTHAWSFMLNSSSVILHYAIGSAHLKSAALHLLVKVAETDLAVIKTCCFANKR
jgi:hypothetical protein